MGALRIAGGVVGALLLMPPCIAQTHPSSKAAAPLSTADAAVLTRALSAYDSGDAASAKPELERLATKYPTNFPANEALGILYVEAGDFAHALPFLEHAAATKPNDAPAQTNLGAAYLQANDAKAAVRVLHHATIVDPRNAAAFASLGRALFLNKQPAEAAKAFAHAAELDHANTDDTYNWALALYDAHKDAEAATVLERTPAAQRTESVEALWGDVEERRGHFKEAVEHMQSAARIAPSEATTYAVAMELLRHWSWEPAMQMTQFGVKQYPQSVRMQLANGIAYFGSGRYVEASGVFGALLASDPANENYGSLLGRSCAATGGAAAAECDSLIAFADKHPKNAQIDVSAAVSLLHQPSAEQHLDQAQGLLETAIRNDPKIPEAWYQLGVLQQQRLQWKESAVSLAKAVELRPTFAEAHYRLSRAYSHTGQPELAKAEIALQQRYSQQEKDESNAKLKEVTIFLVGSH